MTGIYLPTLKRPHRLEEVVKNIEAATIQPYKLYFGVEPEDEASIKELERLGQTIVVNKGQPGLPDTLQTIYEASDEPIFLWANDDFHFLDGWDVAPLKMFEDFPDIGVLGVHDGNPDTNFSAISMIRRSYIEEQSGVVDMPNRVLYPYHHNFADTELTMTAQRRNAWDKCTAPCIRHLHPSFMFFEDRRVHDEVYRKNDLTMPKDLETFHSRKPLFM